MSQHYTVHSLPRTCYVGLHVYELPFYKTIKKRLKAVSYEGGEFELFYYITTLFEDHEARYSSDVKIAMWFDQLKEKVTQLIICQESFLKKVERFNFQMNASSDNKFHFNENYAVFITEAESIILKVASILDISVQIYSRLTGNSINGFGKWNMKARDGSLKHPIDKKLQNATSKHSTLILNHRINNKVKHHESLKLFPVKLNGKWHICLTGAPCNSKLLLLDGYITSLVAEATQFLSMLDKNIAKNRSRSRKPKKRKGVKSCNS